MGPLVGALAAAPAHAQPTAEGEAAPAPAWRWSGFGTVGATHHDNPGVGVIQDFSQRKPALDGWSGRLDSVLGVQLDAQLLAATSATVQGVLRAGDADQPRARMAYVRQGLGDELSLRLGRVRSPLFLDSDVGEIGYAYLTARPSIPVYAAAANNVSHIDGGDLQWRLPLGSAGLLVQAFYGNSAYQHVFYNLGGARAQAEAKGIKGVALSLNLPDVTLRLAHTRFDRFTMRSPQIDQLNAAVAQVAGGLGALAGNPLLPPQAQAALQAQAAAVQGYQNLYDNRPVYSSIGVDATLAGWRAMVELAQFDSQTASVGKYRGWHGTLGYSFDTVTPYLTASRNRRVSAPLDTGVLQPTGLGPAAAQIDAGIAQLRGALDQAAGFANLSTRAAGIGLRWDARDNLAVKVQLEQMSTPSSTTPGVFAVPTLPIDPKVRLFSATLDFVF